MIEVEIPLDLVESLIDGGENYVGTVLLGELKDLMENSISVGLLEGRSVSIRGAFEEAWSELVVVEASLDKPFSSDSD